MIIAYAVDNDAIQHNTLNTVPTVPTVQIVQLNGNTRNCSGRCRLLTVQGIDQVHENEGVEGVAGLVSACTIDSRDGHRCRILAGEK